MALVNAPAERPSQAIIKYREPLTASRGQCLGSKLPEPPGQSLQSCLLTSNSRAQDPVKVALPSLKCGP